VIGFLVISLPEFRLEIGLLVGLCPIQSNRRLIREGNSENILSVLDKSVHEYKRAFTGVGE